MKATDLEKDPRGFPREQPDGILPAVSPKGRPRNEPGQPVSGKQIRAKRAVIHEMTAAELGKKLGVSENVVLAWERGERKPNPDQLKALAKALRCNPADLAPDPK